MNTVRIRYRVTTDTTKLLPTGTEYGETVILPVPGSISLADRIYSALIGHYAIEPFSVVLEVKRGGRWHPAQPERRYELVPREEV